MRGYRDILRAAALATRPRPDQLRRVRARVLSHLPDALVTRVLGRSLAPPSPDAASRVRSRVLVSPRRRPPVGPSVGVALAVGAIAAWFMAFRLTGSSTEPTPAPFVATMEASGGLTRSSPIAGVDLEFEGVGRMEVDGRSVHVRWDVGLLRVEVAPDQGIALDVATREGTVRVVGTGFTVERSALGTAVKVTHGLVEVDCTDEPPRRYRAGEAALCLPTSAAGLLGRAQALADAGAARETVLEALDRALSLSAPGEPVRMEIEATRVFLLFELGRNADALVQAEAYLGRPGAPREDEVRALAEDLRRRLP